ncbi:MAG TPA: helix-turn-helix domain-containing protein [Candidatus Mediterraneibacter surreyensis]|nr:helix-turn-helix domain-containing protein [Candidatus Mediterraneibacter surreyensis]
MGEVRFMISEAAKQVDVETHVLRYWEEELGLTIGRTEMGHRYYTNDDIQLFRCIKKLKDEGMLLRDLKPLIPELKATRLKLKTSKETEHLSVSAQNSKTNTAASASSEDTIPDASSASLSPVTSALSDHTPEQPEVVIPLEKLDQIRALFGDVFREVLSENNDELKKDISSTVTTDVMHEIDFLLQAKDRQQEEHFRKLDALIRQQQANRKESAKASPIMKLRKIFT